jgi:glycosyltransferase involved in cell wall biosynthesis
LKIAQITPYFYPVEGGVERHVLCLSRELVARGHEVDIYTCKKDRNGGRLDSESCVDGLTIHRFRSILSLGEFGRVWPGFMTRVAGGNYDVVHSHVYRHPHSDLALITSKLAGCESILTPHSPFHPASVRKRLPRILVPFYDTVIGPISLKGFDGIISLTSREAEKLIALGAPRSNLRIIPHGVDKVHFETVDVDDFNKKFSLEGRKQVLYLGRINRTKGLDLLVEAFSEIADKLKDASLVLAGPCTDSTEEQYRDELMRLASSLGISGRLVMTGPLSEAEKLAAYQSCSVFVLPSIYEPYGIVLLEAAAHGKPIISTATDGPASIIKDGHTGFLIEPGDKTALVHRLLAILSDGQLAKRLGSNGREFARSFTWEKVASQVESSYVSFGA